MQLVTCAFYALAIVGLWYHRESKPLAETEYSVNDREWQLVKRVLDERGQTLPFAEAVYDDLEIGLSAHSESDSEAIVYVDDVVISDMPVN